MWNYDEYKTWLKNRIVEIKNSLDFNTYNVEVYNEQDYAKGSSIKPKTITFVIKFLPATMILNAKTQPIQMFVITEENSLTVANSITNKFCNDYNFRVTTEGTTYTKHLYPTPAVLSNFNLIGIGLRTVLYINATLLILEDVMDITNLKVDIGLDQEISLDPMSATIGYTMQGDTQPFDGGYAQTVKNFATCVMTLNVACVKNDFTQLVIQIMANSSSNKGNETFKFSFYIGDIQFTNFSMKLTGATFTTAKNNVPSIQMSFSV